jgi:chromosome segregation ATPase
MRPSTISRRDLQARVEALPSIPDDKDPQDLVQMLELQELARATREAQEAEREADAAQARIPGFQEQFREQAQRWQELRAESEELERALKNPEEYLMSLRQERMNALRDAIANEGSELEELRGQFRGGATPLEEYTKRLIELKKKHCLDQEMVKRLEEVIAT